MEQIRNLAISGVDTLEKAKKVCEIVGVDLWFKGLADDTTWFFDSSRGYIMGHWDDQEEHDNFKNCTQMTYEEFLEKYGNEWVDESVSLSERMSANLNAVSADKHEMEIDSEEIKVDSTEDLNNLPLASDDIITPESVKELDEISELNKDLLRQFRNNGR